MEFLGGPASKSKNIVELKPKVETGLTEEELEVLRQLNSKDIGRLTTLYTKNLLLKKDEIVAVRSEDLIYFLKCIHDGYLPVGTGPIMNKGSANIGENFFVTPNPDHVDIKQNPESFPALSASLRGAISSNYEMYGFIATKNALYRNFISKEISNEEFDNLSCQYGVKYGLEDTDEFKDVPLSLLRENFLGKLSEEIQEFENGNSVLGQNRTPAFFILSQYMLSNGVDSNALIQKLNKFKNRGSIVIAFNNKILKYDTIPDGRHCIDEAIFSIPEGRVDLDMILGFETMGEFEDDIIELLGII